MMKRYCWIMTGLFAAGCGAPQGNFAEDPLCVPCVARACDAGAAGTAELRGHTAALSPDLQAQIIAQMEMHPGCIESNSAWAGACAGEAYDLYGAAFYDDSQPWIETRGARAFDEVIRQTKNARHALGYITRHAGKWQKNPDTPQKLEKLLPHAENIGIFELCAETGGSEILEKLSELEPTPERDRILFRRWPELPEKTRMRAVKSWISAKWSMQTSGSSQLPQYIALDWTRMPLPEGTPGFTAALRVKSIKIRGEEAKRGKMRAADTFAAAPLTEPDTRHFRTDLHPWLSGADNVRIYAGAEIKIWPENTDPKCLEFDSECTDAPYAAYDVELDRRYRVFIGVDTGAPHRLKNAGLNAETAEKLSLDICNDTSCVEIYRGKTTGGKTRSVLPVTQGHDFYVRARFSQARYPVASRLMARAGDGRAWREIATFYSDAPIRYDVPARAEIDLGDLCGTLGKCALQLQLRPSLRMARRDPRIERYWGSTLDLGTVTLDIQSLTAKQMWSRI